MPPILNGSGSRFPSQRTPLASRPFYPVQDPSLPPPQHNFLSPHNRGSTAKKSSSNAIFPFACKNKISPWCLRTKRAPCIDKLQLTEPHKSLIFLPGPQNPP